MMRALFFLVVFSIPFGTRKLLFQFTPGFHEYETAAIYAADLFLVVFTITVLIHAFKNRSGGNFKFQISNFKTNLKSKTVNVQTVLLVVFLFFAGVSVFFAPSLGLALYSFARLLAAAAFAVAVAYALRRGMVQLRHIFGILAASAVFQSLIAFAQFVKQGSVGFWFLGEPVLSAQAIGIAKFVAEGGKILRAYGTFPHPNILGAFLVVGLLSCMYLLFQSNANNANAREHREQSCDICSVRICSLVGITLFCSLFFILLGLVLTFSRSAWLVAIVTSTALLLYCFLWRELRARALFLLLTLFIISFSLFTIFSPFIFPRAQISATEPSVVQRLEYNRLGVTLIAQHPLGIGIGNQVMHSVRNGLYEKFGMDKVWQWEPVHNIYLLMASEIGIVGGLSFILLLAALLISNFKCQMSKFGFGHFIRNCLPAGDVPKGQKLGIRNFQNGVTPLDVAIPRIILFALLLFGLVDHFLWTLRPGQLMLWLAIGVAWGYCGNAKQGVVSK